MRRKKHLAPAPGAHIVGSRRRNHLFNLAFRFINPPITPACSWRSLRGPRFATRGAARSYVAAASLAAIASEDGRFCSHWGVDWGR